MALAFRVASLHCKTFFSISSRGTTLTGKCKPDIINVCGKRGLSQESSSRLGHAVRKGRTRTLKEIAYAPAGEGAFTVGRGVVAGCGVAGIGALCYYGLGLSNEPGALDRVTFWPQVVKDRIRATYMYFGGSIGLTALSALAVARTPALMNLVMKNSWLALGATLAALIGSGMLVRSVPYESGFGTKQLTWMLHSGILGAVVAPITLLGGPLLIRAAWITAGVVGGLSAVAVCAPSEKFLNMGGPLAMGLGAVVVASLGGMFFPASTAVGASLYSISVYGGLALFGLFLLYDTQKIIHVAEGYPVYANRPYDPVNQSIGIYLDTVNIFIRIAMILSGSGRKK